MIKLSFSLINGCIEYMKKTIYTAYLKNQGSFIFKTCKLNQLVLVLILQIQGEKQTFITDVNVATYLYRRGTLKLKLSESGNSFIVGHQNVYGYMKSSLG